MPIKCRNCGGDHFTSKCGKQEKQNSVEKKVVVEEKEKTVVNNTKHYPKKISKSRNKIRKPMMYNREKVYKIKISNIPLDLTLKNLNKMMVGWGKIGNIKLGNNREDKTKYAIIDFYDEEASKYFIEALDTTPIGHNMISVSKY